MTHSNDEQIKNIIANIKLSDGTSVQDRSSNIITRGNNVGFSLDVTGLKQEEAQLIQKITNEKLKAIKTIDKISIVLTSSKPISQSTKQEKAKIHIENVDKVILVASGKGGVGKSTIAALLAYQLSAYGKKIGIIDADIYGPSIPHMFGLNGKPELDGNKMIPLENYGICINSIGFLTEASASISWRGPMVSKALYQLLSLTKWGNLDYLIVDTPPGTGDIHLSLLENYIIDNVVMVTTPQEISAIDVTRSINLYKKFNIPISGIIENMSYYEEPETGQKINLFAGDAGEKLARENNIELLAKIPICPDLSQMCDLGQNFKEYSKQLDYVCKKLQAAI